MKASTRKGGDVSAQGLETPGLIATMHAQGTMKRGGIRDIATTVGAAEGDVIRVDRFDVLATLAQKVTSQTRNLRAPLAVGIAPDELGGLGDRCTRVAHRDERLDHRDVGFDSKQTTWVLLPVRAPRRDGLARLVQAVPQDAADLVLGVLAGGPPPQGQRSIKPEGSP